MKKLLSLFLTLILLAGFSVTVFAEGEEIEDLPLTGDFLWIMAYDGGGKGLAFDSAEAPHDFLRLDITFTKHIDGEDKVTEQTIYPTTNTIRHFKLNASPSWITGIKITTRKKLVLTDFWLCALTWSEFPHRKFIYADDAFIKSGFKNNMPVTLPAGESQLLSGERYKLYSETFKPFVVTTMQAEYDVVTPINDTGKPVEVSANIGDYSTSYYLGHIENEDNMLSDRFTQKGHEKFSLNIDSTYGYSFENLKKIRFIIHRDNLGLKIENLKIEVCTELLITECFKYMPDRYLIGKSVYEKGVVTFDSDTFSCNKNEFKVVRPLSNYYKSYFKEGIEYVGSMFGDANIWAFAGFGGGIIGFFIGFLIRKITKRRG